MPLLWDLNCRGQHKPLKLVDWHWLQQYSQLITTKCLLNLWRTAGESNYGQSRTEVVCWWLQWKGLLMWVCEELERKFRGQSEKAWEKHPAVSSHSPHRALCGQFIQEHQTLIGFLKWGAIEESLICISRSSTSINFSMHTKKTPSSHYYAYDFVSQQMMFHLKWIKTKLNKMKPTRSSNSTSLS